MNEHHTIRDTTSGLRVECPIWHSPLFRVVADGIDVSCKSCRGEIHHFSRSYIEQKWNELEQVQESAIIVAKQVL
jgi:hypothetical protein